MRLQFRAWVDGGRLLFDEYVELPDDDDLSPLERLGESHVTRLAEWIENDGLWVIEIELLDATDPEDRFFRFGTDEQAMIVPIEIVIST